MNDVRNTLCSPSNLFKQILRARFNQKKIIMAQIIVSLFKKKKKKSLVKIRVKSPINK